MSASKTDAEKTTVGAIDANALYPLPELMRLTGWGAGSFRSARRQGLRVRYAGRHAFVFGRDFLDHIEKRAKDTR